jgi:hypothetical protein
VARGKAKTPKAGKNAGLRAVKAVPNKAARPLETDDGCLIIRFNQIDVAGPFSMANASSADLVRIMAAVKQFETMRPLDAFSGQPGKDYKTAELPSKQTRDRLIELEHDDEDIACLRLSGTGRLWGFRRGRYFHVLWWDPDHQVWPSRKKHT